MLFKNWCAQQKYIASAVIILFVTACDSDGGNQSTPVTAQAAATCGADVFAAGTVSREFTATTFNEPFVASDEAHVLIQLATAFADGPSTTLVEQDIAFAEIPFEFAICGNATEIEQMRQGELFISVRIYNHIGTDARVGDLVSEKFNSIEGPDSGLEILVSGLEDCSSPNTGGFCTTNR